MGEAKSTISEITRRYHELELELRRLENERDELTAAYKEAEAVIIKYQPILSLNSNHFHQSVGLRHISFVGTQS